MKSQLAAALPRHMSPDHMTRIVTTKIRKTPELAECDLDMINDENYWLANAMKIA